MYGTWIFKKNSTKFCQTITSVIWFGVLVDVMVYNNSLLISKGKSLQIV